MNGTDNVRRWYSRMSVGHMAYAAGSYTQAVRHFRLALELSESLDLADSLRTRALTGLAKSLAALGKFEEAERMIQSALQVDEGSPDAVAECAEDYHQLSLLCWRSGRNAESMGFAQRAYELVQKAGHDAPDELRAKLLKHFAVLSEQAGNVAETERCLNRAIEFIEGSSELGKTSMIYGDVLLVKVLFLAEQGRLDEAAELYPQAMQIVAMTRGLQHPRVEEAMSIFRDMETAEAVSNADRAKRMETARNNSRHGIV